MLAVLACNNSKLNMVNENDPWDKYAGIERYWDHIEKILPFYNHINEHFRQTVNPEQLPHALTIRKKNYSLNKSLNNAEIHAIQAETEVNIDTIGSIKLDTFGLYYGALVSSDTSFGILFITAGRNIMISMACKVYEDSLGHITEEAAIKREGSGEIIKARAIALNDSTIYATWLLQDTTTWREAIFQGNININSKEVPEVYNEIANFMNENEFFYMDSTKIPPVELMDEFFKEVYADEKAIDWNSSARSALSGAITGVIGALLRLPTRVIYAAISGAALSGLNDLIYQLLWSNGVENPIDSDIDWYQFYNDFYNYLLEYGFDPPPADATYGWWPGWN